MIAHKNVITKEVCFNKIIKKFRYGFTLLHYVDEKRIVQITNAFGKTGIGNYSRWINIAAHEFSKMYLLDGLKDENPVGEIEEIKAMGLPFTTNWWFRNHFPSIAYLKFINSIKKIREQRKIIIHCLNPGVPFIGDVVDLVTFHDIIAMKSSDNSSRAYIKLMRSNFKKYFNVGNAIVTTNYVKRDLESFGYTGTVHVIGYPVDKSFFCINDKAAIRKKLGLPLDKKILLSVSTPEPRKNIKIIQKVMESFSDNYELVRVGRGIEANKTYENLSPAELNLLYNSADVFLSTSLEEGFGLPSIEAMACGLPVVLSDREFFREVADNAAVYVDPLDIESIKYGVEEALSDSQELIKKGKIRANYYSFENFSKSLKGLYVKLLNS